MSGKLLPIVYFSTIHSYSLCLAEHWWCFHCIPYGINILFQKHFNINSSREVFLLLFFKLSCESMVPDSRQKPQQRNLCSKRFAECFQITIAWFHIPRKRDMIRKQMTYPEHLAIYFHPSATTDPCCSPSNIAPHGLVGLTLGLFWCNFTGPMAYRPNKLTN